MGTPLSNRRLGLNILIVRALALLWLAGVLVTISPGARAEHSSLGTLFTLVGDCPRDAATTRTAYQSIDAAAPRSYIAKMGEGKLLVYYLAQDRLIRASANMPKITGVLAVPQLHRVY